MTTCERDINLNDRSGGDVVRLCGRAMVNGEVRLASSLFGCWSSLETSKVTGGAAQTDSVETKRMRVANRRSWSCIAKHHARTPTRKWKTRDLSSLLVSLVRVSGHCVVSKSLG